MGGVKGTTWSEQPVVWTCARCGKKTTKIWLISMLCTDCKPVPREMTEVKKIGYSVSMCIMDIIKGRVRLSDVVKIVGSTKARYQADWNEVIDTYRERYWMNDPDLGEAVCRWLIMKGKIEQPRLRNPGYGRTLPPVWEDVEDRMRPPDDLGGYDPLPEGLDKPDEYDPDEVMRETLQKELKSLDAELVQLEGRRLYLAGKKITMEHLLKRHTKEDEPVELESGQTARFTFEHDPDTDTTRKVSREVVDDAD